MTVRIPPRVRDLPPRPFEAVLWDFDGTLLDTEPLWWQAEQRAMARLGATMPDGLAEQLVGSSLLPAAATMLRHVPGTSTTPEELVAMMVSEMTRVLAAGEAKWRPGAKELLAELHRAGVPQALVSASYRSMLMAVVDTLPPGTFAAVVSGDEVERGKPDPMPYLLAAERLGVDPRRCLVVEDSVAGAASGNAAGCLVLAVPNVVTPPPAPRRVPLETLVGLDLAGLAGLWEQHA